MKKFSKKIIMLLLALCILLALCLNSNVNATVKDASHNNDKDYDESIILNELKISDISKEKKIMCYDASIGK